MYLYLTNQALTALKKTVMTKNTPKKIAISGATGFIGSHLGSKFEKDNQQVVAISRESLYGKPEELARVLSGVDVVIHLAGAPIIARWTTKNRQEIYDSRIQTTRNLVHAMKLLEKKPETFICGSAVNIYPFDGTYTEESPERAIHFAGKVCQDWELEANKAGDFVRTLNFRFGVVLGKNEGALKKMELPFKLGVGGRVGHGKQMMTWVHIDDVVGAMEFAINKPNLEGPVNVCSPKPVSNKEFTKTLAGVLKKPAFIPVPPFALKLLYGKGSIVIIKGLSAIPEKLEKAGYTFRHPTMDEALENIYKK